MGNEQSKQLTQAEADLQREIREGRKFSLAEAIGRLAGPGMMKGASPTTGKQQATAQLESFLERHLQSPAGALSAVLLRQVIDSELLLSNLDQPFVVLASYVQRTLDSEPLLQELVREADAEWGRIYGERPYFQKAGCPPDQADPYTAASVSLALSEVLKQLAAATPGTLAAGSSS